MYSSSNSSHSQPSAQIIRILWRQQQELLKKSPDCVFPVINNEDPLDIQADIIGPKGTPYENGTFRVKLFITGEFPQAAPKGFFMTEIYHPNVSEKGEICVNTLKKDWNPKQWSLYNLFEVIKCLLIIPFPESSLNEEAGKVFMENYEEYCKIARIYTNIHAMKKNDIAMEESTSLNNAESNSNIQSMFENSAHKNNNNNNNDDVEMEDETRIKINRSRTMVMPEPTNLFGFVQRTNSNVFNMNNDMGLEIIQEKPIMLGSLPFIRSNSLRMSSNNLVNRPMRTNSSYAVAEQTKRSSKEEINKWLMRI